MWPVMVRVGDEDAIVVWGQLLPVLLLLSKVSSFKALDIETPNPPS